VINFAYSNEMINHEIERHGYIDREEYRKQFNASSVARSLEINIRKILDGKKDDHQSTFDIYDVKNSWAKTIEVRGITDTVCFSSSTNTGKGRFFSIKDFNKKINGNDAFVICDFNDLIIFDRQPRLYMIPTDIVKGLFNSKILTKEATMGNDWSNAKKISKGFGFRQGFSLNFGEDLTTYPNHIFNMKFYHVFPYDTFKLTTNKNKNYPNLSEIIKNAKIRLQIHRETGKISH
jgi:hypothetical protein